MYAFLRFLEILPNFYTRVIPTSLSSMFFDQQVHFLNILQNEILQYMKIFQGFPNFCPLNALYVQSEGVLEFLIEYNTVHICFVLVYLFYE